MASALALLIARLMIGPALAAHGAQELLGWFGGHGLKATAGIFGSIGFPAPLLMAALASLGLLVLALRHAPRTGGQSA